MENTTINFEPINNNFIFCLKNEEVIVIDEDGFKYKGELIEDKGEVYRLFKEFLKQDKTK